MLWLCLLVRVYLRVFEDGSQGLQGSSLGSVVRHPAGQLRNNLSLGLPRETGRCGLKDLPRPRIPTNLPRACVEDMLVGARKIGRRPAYVVSHSVAVAKSHIGNNSETISFEGIDPHRLGAPALTALTYM